MHSFFASPSVVMLTCTSDFSVLVSGSLSSDWPLDLYFLVVVAVARDDGGNLRVLSSVNSGVIQGCALSGLLLALSSDPILNEFVERICPPKLGRARACADDVGCTLRSIVSLGVAF